MKHPPVAMMEVEWLREQLADAKAALRRCCEVIENDVAQLRREGFEGASWQLDAIRKARAVLGTKGDR